MKALDVLIPTVCLLVVAALAVANLPGRASQLVISDYVVECQHACLLEVDWNHRLVVADSVKGGWLRWRVGDKQGVTTNPWIRNKPE
jgi:hypothetical protein